MSGRRRKEHVKRIARAPRAVLRACSSGKVGWATRNLARYQGALTAAARGIPIGVYRCGECGRWHKTKNTWGTTQPSTKEARRNGT